MSSSDIRIRRLVDAPIEATFRHWTDPDSRRHWCAPDPTWPAAAWSDLRVGGAWGVRFGPTPDETYRVEGVYLEVDAPHRLVYTSLFTYPDGRSFETTTTVTFEPRGTQTALTFVDAGFPADEDPTPFDVGTASVLDSFQRTLAGS